MTITLSPGEPLQRWRCAGGLALLLSACSVDQRSVDTVGTGGSGSAAPSGDVVAAGNTPDAGADARGTSLGDARICLSESRSMSLLPSALYLMLDTSGSMDETRD